jgi:hypothetical protein
MMRTRIHNLKFWIFRPLLFKHAISFLLYQHTNWCGLPVEGALHRIVSQRKTKQTGMTYCMATIQKSRNFIALKPKDIFTHTAFQYLQTVNNSLYILFSLSFTLQELSWAHLYTHISFTIWFNRSRKRIWIKMVYFTRHLCFQLVTNCTTADKVTVILAAFNNQQIDRNRLSRSTNHVHDDQLYIAL